LSLIASDCMLEENSNGDGLNGAGVPERLTAVSIFEPKDYSRTRWHETLFQMEGQLIVLLTLS